MTQQAAIYILTAFIFAASLMAGGCAEIKNVPIKFMETAQQHSDGGG